MENKNDFLVHIACMTYNHESFIKDAMNGFVMQDTSFPFVAIIIDDASTDKTRDVIRQYLIDHFTLDDSLLSRKEDKEYGQVLFAQNTDNKNCFFAVIFLNENHYQRKKSKRDYYLEWSDTKYRAICEGDDYWTDSRKLQKQVEYLESHPDCMLSVHAANWKVGDNLFPYGCVEEDPKDYSVQELIRCGGLFFATASFVYRAEIDRDWPEWRQKAGVGDYPIQILSGLHGRVHFLPESMCVYRYQREGSWTSNNLGENVSIDFQKNKIEWMTLLDKTTEHRYQREIYDQLFQPYNILFNYREIGFGTYAKAVYRSGQKRYGRLMKDFLRLYLTPFYRFLSCFKKKRYV